MKIIIVTLCLLVVFLVACSDYTEKISEVEQYNVGDTLYIHSKLKDVLFVNVLFNKPVEAIVIYKNDEKRIIKIKEENTVLDGYDENIYTYEDFATRIRK